MKKSIVDELIAAKNLAQVLKKTAKVWNATFSEATKKVAA